MYTPVAAPEFFQSPRQASRVPVKTPVKSLSRHCVVCGQSGITRYNFINSEAGRKKHLSELLLKYGGVNISEGTLCASDQDRLLTLDKKVNEFSKRCQETIRSLKRGSSIKRCSVASSPSQYQTPSKHVQKKQILTELKNLPQRRQINKELFSSTPKPITGDNGSDSTFSIRKPRKLLPLHEKNEVSPIQSQVHTPLHSLTPQFPQSFVPGCTPLSDSPSPSNSIDVQQIIQAQDKTVPLLRQTKKGYISVMMKPYGSTSYEQLENFKWASIVEEFKRFFPFLYHLVVSLMLPKETRADEKELSAILPRLGMVYAICLQKRIHNLSLVQRMVSTILTEGLCDVKVNNILLYNLILIW